MVNDLFYTYLVACNILPSTIVEVLTFSKNIKILLCLEIFFVLNHEEHGHADLC